MKIAWTILLLIAVNLSYGQSYTFVFLHKKQHTDSTSKEDVARLMEGHMANIDRLAAEGKLLAAGPFEGGGGMFVLNTTSPAQAKEWLSTDPGVQAKRWDVEILPYTPVTGKVCKAIAPYEMVAYHFYRVSSKNNKEASHLQKVMDDLSQTPEMIAHGRFGKEDEFFIVRNVIALQHSDKNNFNAEQKKLWIAKGSFCEK